MLNEFINKYRMGLFLGAIAGTLTIFFQGIIEIPVQIALLLIGAIAGAVLSNFIQIEQFSTNAILLILGVVLGLNFIGPQLGLFSVGGALASVGGVLAGGTFKILASPFILITGGLGLLAIPDPTMITKVMGTIAIIAGLILGGTSFFLVFKAISTIWKNFTLILILGSSLLAIMFLSRRR